MQISVLPNRGLTPMLQTRNVNKLIAVASIVLATSLAHSQTFGSQSRSVARADTVQYLFPEQVTVPAGKSSPVTLHFRIAQGLHINSHAPRPEELIPTTFS